MVLLQKQQEKEWAFPGEVERTDWLSISAVSLVVKERHDGTVELLRQVVNPTVLASKSLLGNWLR